MQVRTKATAIVMACLLGATLYGAHALTGRDPDERTVTLSTVWGDGTKNGTPAAYMHWTVGNHRDSTTKPGGRWAVVVYAKKGDHVTLIITTANGVESACSIQSGSTWVSGQHRCEILSLP